MAFLGLLTVVQITLFLSWRKNSSLFTKYFNKDNAQEYEIHILEDGNVTAYSHVVQEVVQR